MEKCKHSEFALEMIYLAQFNFLKATLCYLNNKTINTINQSKYNFKDISVMDLEKSKIEFTNDTPNASDFLIIIF